MSTNRYKRDHVPMDQMERGPNGRRLCRECRTEVTPPRLTFCSKECVDAYQVKTNAGFMRGKVYERDKGICALCSRNTVAEHKVWKDARPDPYGTMQGAEYERAWTAWVAEGKRMGWSRSNSRNAWDADHIVPVCEGGGECSIDNIRTLCIPCHKAVTAELAARRSKPKPKVAVES